MEVMLFFARDPALRPACALPDLGTVRGPKMLICLVKSLNWLPLSLPSSCISGLGEMTDFGPLYYFSGFLLIARL